MLIYILVILFLFVIRNTKNKFWYFISFIILFALAAFRDLSVGTDAVNYLERYDYVDENADYFSNVFIVRGEFFESLLYITGHRLNLSYRTILEIETVIFLCLVFGFFQKRVQKPITGVLIFVLLYYYFGFFNIFRNIMAISVVMYGYLFLEDDVSKQIRYSKTNKRIKKTGALQVVGFILITIIGSLIHQSVIVFLLLLPLKYVRLDIKIVIILSIITLFIGMVFDASTLLSIYTNLFETTSKYSGYVQNMGSHIVIAPFFELFFMIAFYYFYNKKLDLTNNIYFKAWVFEFLFINAFGFASTYGSRIVLSFSVARCVLFADSLSVKNKNGDIIVYIYLLYCVTRSMIAGYDGVIPYKFMPL